MAAVICHLFLTIFSFLSLSTPLVNASAPPGAPAASPTIQKICSITSFPDVCALHLANSTPVDPLDILKYAISLSVGNTVIAQNMVSNVLKTAGNNQSITACSNICLEELNNSLFRLESSVSALPSQTKDVRAWMTAVVMHHSGCFINFKTINETVEIHNLVSFLEPMSMMASNVLIMVRAFDLFGSDIGKWVAPKTERAGFFEPVKSEEWEFPTKFPSDLKVDATVSKDGTGYKTVQEAVDAAPSNLTYKKFVVSIKEGIYDEIVRIPLNRRNLVLIGDGIGKTIITGNLTVGPIGISTYSTATVAVLGDGFMAKGITFENTAGKPTKQAVALRSDGDKSYFENCEFKGHQDTLYCHGLRQFYKSCRIEGNIDFIFGNSAAYFKDCEIFINPRLENPEKGAKNAVTAHGRREPAQSTGFVFDNCSITGTPEYMKYFQRNPKAHLNYLGRPWKEYSRTVFIRSFLDHIITPGGWLEWEGNQSLSTLYYGEYENKGPGSDLNGRVQWSSQIPSQHVSTFSVQNFIQGDEWLPKG